MTVDPAVVPGFLLLLAQLVALAGVGFLVVRVVLRQADDRMALAQGLVVGPALWGLITNFVLYAVPGLAGAALGWTVTLALGAVIAWRAPHSIRLQPRVVAGFAVVVLALWWVGLASRQLLDIPDEGIRLGLAASIRAGGFPPELPWNPGSPLRYHYGANLLVGLLTPPFGPDLAFVWEFLGVYAWAGFMLVVVTALAARGSWRVALLLAPLLLTSGLWTWQSFGPGILQGPAPAGLPAAGLRASLADIYWPPLEWGQDAALPDIWKPTFTLAYALAVVVLERVASAEARSWPATLTLAVLVGSLGLLSTTLTPVVLLLWAGLAAVRVVTAWRARTATWGAVLRPGAGLALAVGLLLAGGGRFTGILEGSAASGLAWWWDGDPRDWRVLGVFEARPGGVGLLALGPVALAGIAALVAWRDRLVLALGLGAVLLATAWLVLRFEPNPSDLDRLAGHARNLALIALLLALSGRLPQLRPRWRYAVGALLLGLVIWPTSARPVRDLGMALGQGIEVANAASMPSTSGDDPAWGWERTAMPAVPARVATYIRDNTAVDARVLVPEAPYLAVAYATGRPNSSGYADALHMLPTLGPEFMDARNHLEPSALRRLGIDYIYATDDWISGLPDRGARWLADAALFEPVIRDGAVSLYRVRAAFLALDPPPAPASFEALRQGIPAGTTVYWPSGASFDKDTVLRVASVLSPEARLFGELKYVARRTYRLTPVPTERLNGQTPDLVIVPAPLEPWMFPPNGRQPIWWNHEMAIYAPNGAVAPIMPPPPDAGPPPEPPPVRVQVSDVRVADGRDRLHDHRRRHRAGSVDGAGLGGPQGRRIAVVDPQSLARRQARHRAMVRWPAGARTRDHHPRLRLRCRGVQPVGARWRRRLPRGGFVDACDRAGRLDTGDATAPRGGPRRLPGTRGSCDYPGAEGPNLRRRRGVVCGA